MSHNPCFAVGSGKDMSPDAEWDGPFFSEGA